MDEVCLFQDTKSVVERFIESGNQRTVELERRLDSYIEQMKIGTEATVRKFNLKR
jgi:hypothetical protein